MKQLTQLMWENIGPKWLKNCSECLDTYDIKIYFVRSFLADEVYTLARANIFYPLRRNL